MDNYIDKVWDDVYHGSGRTRTNYDILNTHYSKSFKFMSWQDFVNNVRQDF